MWVSLRHWDAVPMCEASRECGHHTGYLSPLARYSGPRYTQYNTPVMPHVTECACVEGVQPRAPLVLINTPAPFRVTERHVELSYLNRDVAFGRSLVRALAPTKCGLVRHSARSPHLANAHTLPHSLLKETRRPLVRKRTIPTDRPPLVSEI
jgi:hypothetical protein